MSKQKYTFPGLFCPGCQYHQLVGCTRYCNGFPKKRKPQQFRKSDPKYKPPKWCPRLISPPICRIYGFVDEESDFLEWRLNRLDYKPGSQISPSEFRYRLRCEGTLDLTAKQFYDTTQIESVESVLHDIGIELEYGEVFEIDNGLKPYYFYYLKHGIIIPLYSFDRSRVQPSDPAPAEKGGGQEG
jgi:hypothetical protein